MAYGLLLSTVPSPKSHTLLVVRPPISARNRMGKPTATFVGATHALTLSAPVMEPAVTSSQPIEGGVRHASPSMSVPVA